MVCFRRWEGKGERRSELAETGMRVGSCRERCPDERRKADDDTYTIEQSTFLLYRGSIVL